MWCSLVQALCMLAQSPWIHMRSSPSVFRRLCFLRVPILSAIKLCFFFHKVPSGPRGRIWWKYPFRTEISKIYSLHLGYLWVSVFVPICAKRQLQIDYNLMRMQANAQKCITHSYECTSGKLKVRLDHTTLKKVLEAITQCLWWANVLGSVGRKIPGRYFKLICNYKK